MNKNNIKAIGYVRVTNAAQTKRVTSIEMQKRQIVETANNLGLEIVEWFEQVGYKPVTFTHDTLSKALKYCNAEPDIKYLLVANTTRISRSLDHYLFWKIAFERAGVAIKIADGSDLDSPIGTFMEAITKMMSQYKSEQD